MGGAAVNGGSRVGGLRADMLRRAALGLAAAASAAAVNTPFYADPVFDAAHDAEFVWHEGEQCWWSVPTRWPPRTPAPLALS